MRRGDGEEAADVGSKVAQLLASAHKAVDAFERDLDETAKLRRKVLRRLVRVTRRDNIAFDGIERINIELSLKNKIHLLDVLEEFFQGELPVHQEVEKLTQAELLGGRPANATDLVRSASRTAWRNPSA